MDIRAPHCDQRILHAPEENCSVCNKHPEWQQLRELWGINFTGQHDPTKLPCPAEVERPLKSINRWYRNAPVTPEVEKAWEDYYTGMETVIKELTRKRRNRYWGIDD
jgi:hypothetical protein